MYLCIFIFYSDSLPVICEGFWLAVKLRAVNLYNCLFLYVFSSVFIAEMKEVTHIYKENEVDGMLYSINFKNGTQMIIIL